MRLTSRDRLPTGLRPLLFALGLACCVSGAAAEPPGATTTVTAGPEYDVNGFLELWLGKGYRELWTTPVEVPVIDLGAFAGGLQPVRQVGRLQTRGLALSAGDGRSFTFRSLRREPDRALPAEWRESWPGRIVRDHTSATHPGAALLVASLLETAGLLHATPELVVLPHDAALGEFRAGFGGHIGTLAEFPLAGRGSFAGATEIVRTSELWQRWLAGEARVDARAFLRARLVDLLAENYDRHEGQWRWVRLAGEPLWQPLSEDPDMAFIRNEGLALALVRGRAPKFVQFGARYGSRLEGSTRSGAELDRWLLSGLDRAAFEQSARSLQARLTDAALDAAVERLPAEWQQVDGVRLKAALRARRDGLVDVALRWYRDLSHAVDVQTTDRDDVVELRRDGDQLELTVADAGAGEPWYRRRFTAGETSEIRVRLRGGDDRVMRIGEPGGPIRVRVVAGPGEDHVDDSAGGGTEVWEGEGKLTVAGGRGTRRRDAWTNPRPDPDRPWAEPRDFGRWTMPYTEALWVPELDFLLGFGATQSRWGFRAQPEAARHDFSALYSTGEQSARVRYDGLFRRPASRAAFRFEALYSGIERINFFGFGNETARPADSSRFRTDESFLSVSPAVQLELGDEWELSLAATSRFSSTPGDRRNILNATAAYGSSEFAEAGLRGQLHLDTRGLAQRLGQAGLFETVASGEPSSKDLRLELEGFYFPALLDVKSGFGGLEGELAGYLGRSRSRFQLAARGGGRRVWGEYPWFESAFVGGRVNLRGYSRNRFAGDASLYGSLEGRAWLFSLDVPPVPLRVGVLAFGDAGRVWLEGEHSDEWHRSWGGGVMLQPLATPYVLTAAVARSREQTRWYFGYGFFF